MNNTYQLFIGIDISKGKADAAILKVFDSRSVKSKFLRKKLSFTFTKSQVTEFIEKVRSYRDIHCTSIIFGLEVTGVYSTNVYHAIQSNLHDDESIHFLNTYFVNQWRKTHNISKSDPLDAQTISSIIGTDDDVQYVSDNVYENKNGHQDLKALVHRLYQVKKSYNQESNRLIAQCDCFFPELQYVFEPKSAVFIAILSQYPTTYDIINTTKSEVFHLAYEASKHRVSMDKIDKLFEFCYDTISPIDISNYHRSVIISLVESVKSIKKQMKLIEKDILELVKDFDIYPLLLTIPGCGPITAATIIAETGDIHRFKNADRYVSYAGTSPRNKRSGTSVEIMGKISKKGSSFLRHALYMIAEFARRHNPVLKTQFERIKNGNKKRHKLAVIAIANKIARYIYSILKNKSSFVIKHEDIMKLPKETQNTFLQSISLEFPTNIRKQVYRFVDKYGEVHSFVYASKDQLVA